MGGILAVTTCGQPVAMREQSTQASGGSGPWMLNTGGPCIKYNKIHVLRTKLRVLFVSESLKDETPLVFSVLDRRRLLLLLHARRRRALAPLALRRIAEGALLREVLAAFALS